MLETNLDIIRCEKVLKLTLIVESRESASSVVTALVNWAGSL